jgi:hypothetical protein
MGRRMKLPPCGKEPVSGLDLAIDTVKAIYAAYLSAEKGMRVELDKI